MAPDVSTQECRRLARAMTLKNAAEFLDGKVIHTKARRRRLPVERYRERQGRFRHLFHPRQNEPVPADIQAGLDAYWDNVAG